MFYEIRIYHQIQVFIEKRFFLFSAKKLAEKEVKSGAVAAEIIGHGICKEENGRIVWL